jgi:hypothetical protein
MDDKVKTDLPFERFEAAVLEFGIVSACEWFGHESGSQFTKETLDYFERKKRSDSTNDLPSNAQPNSGEWE